MHHSDRYTLECCRFVVVLGGTVWVVSVKGWKWNSRTSCLVWQACSLV